VGGEGGGREGRGEGEGEEKRRERQSPALEMTTHRMEQFLII
jgi:hypothetical protein